MKNVLVTAGPIPAYIDPIKIVTNGFKGGLAKKTATSLRDDYGHNVDLMVWENDPIKDEDWVGNILRVHDVRDYVKAVRNAAMQYDAIVCAAAVANLIPSNPMKHKFASHELRPGDAVSIPFEIAPRAVDEVKKANPRCTLIAYKCLDADEQTLRDAAMTVQRDAHTDIVFANTPTDAKHKKIAIFKDGATLECDFNTHIALINEAICEHHYKTKKLELVLNPETNQELAHILQQVRLIDSTMQQHGSVAIPINIHGWPDAFVTTARGHQGGPVIVLNVNDENQTIYATGKATLNAPALMATLRAYKKIHPDDHNMFVIHRHFYDDRYHNPISTFAGAIKRIPHINPGTTEEAQAMKDAFSDPTTICVEMQGHGAIYVRHIIPTDWKQYKNIYPKRYLSESKIVADAIKDAICQLNVDIKEAMTLEVGAGGDTECRLALDTSVPAYNAKNITWNDVCMLKDNELDLTIMRNCITYLTNQQLEYIFRTSKHLIANAFASAPKSMLRANECSTCVNDIVTHSLLMASDDLMSHSFYNINQDYLVSLGATITPYGSNSILITK